MPGILMIRLFITSLPRTMKKNIALFLWLLILLAEPGYAQQPERQGDWKELFAGPANTSTRDVWLKKIKQWRDNAKQHIQYDDAGYDEPALEWAKKTFISVQMMAHDRYFYDPVQRKYTVNRYLDDLEKQYGGIDAVLIWPTYPNIGIDSRNQYDLVSDMPGGLPAIKQMISAFHKRGVKVFFPIMIWDHGTRSVVLSMPTALVKEMQTLGADGMNGDTMEGVTLDFKHASDSLHYPIVFQPELDLKDLKMIEWNLMSWGYYWDYTFVPGISVYKWLEPRHQVSVTNRWITDKTNDLQYAFFNGIGYNPWENIWGIWNQISPRDEEAIRRIATIYRQFPDIWSSQDWEPFVPTVQHGIFASKFPAADRTIFTLVNRDSVDTDGPQLRLPYRQGIVYFDLWNGKKLTIQKEHNQVVLSFPIEAHGFGAVMASKDLDPSIQPLLSQMNTLSRKPLKSYSTAWKPLPQQIVPIKKTKSARDTPGGMILIPGTLDYEFISQGVMIEGDPLPTAVGIQYPWETHPARATSHVMAIPSFYMDKYPVTNQQFKLFLDATHYQPKDNHNFLKDWAQGTYPSGWANKPVTWVSLEDARAYAAWAGKRLPHEWEWQYAAVGTTGNRYPWGDTFEPTRIPPLDSGRTMRPPTAVDAFPQGASPFGIMDMVGNVWQWTDEYQDDHTRAAILKGGGYYRATTSNWYFPRAFEVNKYGKYLLMAPSMDRSGSIGFRCVKDR
jgi:hypothetical protein